jgi:type I restriction enzyme S subunit
MWLAHGSVAVSSITGVISPDYRVYNLTDVLWPRFVHHLLQTREYRGLYQLFVRGDTTYDRRVSKDDFHSLPVIVPQVGEQRVIATFLDRKTAAIDALIVRKEQHIELLQEKRQAVITLAVTRGLDPSVSMKDSGAERLGSIPAHWKLLPLRRVLKSIEQGWSPECEGRPAEDGEWGVLKSGCVNRGTFVEEENKALPGSLTARPELEVSLGDILMSRASGSPELIGSVALVGLCRARLMLSDKLYRLKPDSTRVAPEFLRYAMNSNFARQQIEDQIHGAAGLANNIAQSSIKGLLLPMPPRSEGAVIASAIDEQMWTLERLLASIRLGIALLRDYRQALISAAVTGKIDIPAEGAA